jgi:hypothetical protein
MHRPAIDLHVPGAEGVGVHRLRLTGSDHDLCFASQGQRRGVRMRGMGAGPSGRGVTHGPPCASGRDKRSAVGPGTACWRWLAEALRTRARCLPSGHPVGRPESFLHDTSQGVFMTLMQSLSAAVVLAAAWLGAAQAELVTVPGASLQPSPGVYTAGGYYTDELGTRLARSDDASFLVNLGFNVSLFGATFTSLYINTNGNVTFGGSSSTYSTSDVTTASGFNFLPVIAPFLSDVDTRSLTSGLIHYRLDSDQLIVTWDAVGRYALDASVRDSFQLVLRADDFLLPVGEGRIGFFYKDMSWERGPAGMFAAAVGLGDGQGSGSVLEGSSLNGIAASVANQYLWFNPAQADNPSSGVPEPRTVMLAGLALAGLGVTSRKRRSA